MGSDQGLGLRNRQAINDAQSASRSGSSPRDHYARDAARRNGVRTGLSPQSTKQEAESSSQEERRPREGADDGADFVARGQPVTECDFIQAALHPVDPIKRRTSAQRTQAPESVDTPKRHPALMMWTAPPRGHLIAERWSLERHQEGGRPCRNISELASTLPRIPLKSTLWRAKIVPPRNVN